MAQAVVQVCGEGKSLREWAKQRRLNYTPIHEKVAQEIPRSALAALTSHFGKSDQDLVLMRSHAMCRSRRVRIPLSPPFDKCDAFKTVVPRR
jgi:hypothetical protein